MGCDIHCHIEVKINNKWEHYSNPNLPRNYEMFSKMAGVRGILEPIVEPKGLPDDLSVITKIAVNKWKNDGHTFSWFNVEEIKKFEDYLEKDPDWFYQERIHCIWGYLFGNSFGHLKEFRNDCPKEIQDVRLIFWFDN